MSFDREAQLGALWRDGLALADAAERAGLERPVASCPGWSVADLVWHTGEVHYFFATCVREGWSDPSGYEAPERPADTDLLRWYRENVQAAVQVFSASAPDDQAWSWAPNGGTAAWVVRRMAQETAVHRWDAENAAAGTGATPPPVDTELAADGVDEFFEHFSDTAADGVAALGGTVHLHATDGDGEWLVSEPTPGSRLEFSHEHAKGDAAVRGTSSDLLLLLWRRVDLDDAGRFEVFGDVEVARRLAARPDLN